jgi:hypothetical protein
MWPPRSPDLHPCHFNVWGTLTEKVYVNNPYSLEEVHENIRHEISVSPAQQLRRVFRHMFSQCEAFLEAVDRHFEIIL